LSRDNLIDTARTILGRAGYRLSPPMALRSVCFDIVGSRNKTMLIVKVLGNVDALSRENAEEMKVLSEMLGATPLVIGEKSSAGILEPGIVYSRFDIPIISNETLSDYVLRDESPFVMAAPGGLYVKLDSVLLKEIRESRDISLGTLAEVAGVSRRTIQMYESGMGAMIDAAIRIEEYLNAPIIRPVDPFEFRGDRVGRHELSGEERTGSVVLDHLLGMGFSITPVVRSPFEAITRDNRTVILTGLGGETDKMLQRAALASDISVIFGKHSIIVVDDERGSGNIKSTVVVTKKELNHMEDKGELTDLVKTRSGE